MAKTESNRRPGRSSLSSSPSLTNAESENHYLLRKDLLRPTAAWRSRSESVITIFMRIKPRPRRHPAKPARPVVFLDGLCAAVRLAPHIALPRTPFAEATFGALASLGASSSAGSCAWIAAASRFRSASACPTARAWSCAAEHLAATANARGLASLTHIAATRGPQSITSGPAETASRTLIIR